MHSQLLPFVGAAILIALTPGADTLLMTAIAAAASLAWLSVYATVVPRAGDVLRRPPVRRAPDRAATVVLIGLGVRLALTRR